MHMFQFIHEKNHLKKQVPCWDLACPLPHMAREDEFPLPCPPRSPRWHTQWLLSMEWTKNSVCCPMDKTIPASSSTSPTVPLSSFMCLTGGTSCQTNPDL